MTPKKLCVEFTEEELSALLDCMERDFPALQFEPESYSEQILNLHGRLLPLYNQTFGQKPSE